MEREFLESQGLTPEAVEAILAQSRQEDQAHQEQLKAMQLEGYLHSAVARAGGRNVKAIGALLDMAAIAGSEDMAAAMEAAVKDLKDREGYLFTAPQAPPYAAGTGTAAPNQGRPATLAEALRARSQQQ